jgi:signal peptidase I
MKIFLKNEALIKVAYAALVLVVTSLLAAVFIKIFVLNVFPVASSSMSPTIKPGDKVMVDKLIFGPRIYKNIAFFTDKPLSFFRIKGLRGIKHNDIVVFNHASGDDWQKPGFVINSVYVKRCVGLPGDTVTIINSITKNSSYYDTLGFYSTQLQLHETIDTTVLNAYMSVEGTGWTVMDFGPLYLPREGDIIELNGLNYLIYGKYIEYETGKRLISNNGVFYLDDEWINSYRFSSDYYFFTGDNAKDSKDSRYYGPVPGEFIIGVVRFIF